MIIKTINELKTYLGGAVENNASILTSMGPYFDIAFDNHLSPWIGSTTFADLVTAHGDDTLTSNQTALLPYVQKVLAWLAYYEYSGFNDTYFGPAGRYRREDEDRKGLYKYQENKLDDKAHRNGYEAIERLILFLEENKATHTYWTTEPGYEKHHAILLHSAAACRTAHSKQISRFVFEILRGKIEEIEGFTLIHLLGQDTYDQLLTARKTGTWNNETLEKKIIAFANKATLHFALLEAMRENLVRFDGNKVVQSEALEPQSSKKQGVPSAAMVAERLGHHEEFANRHLDYLRKLLTDNIDDPALADYKTHSEAQAQALKDEKTELDNEANAAASGYNPNSERCEPWDVVPGSTSAVGGGAVRL